MVDECEVEDIEFEGVNEVVCISRLCDVYYVVGEDLLVFL